MGKKVREMCAKHGGNVKRIDKSWGHKTAGRNTGYLLRDAIVEMSTNKEASALFDTLNGKEVKGCVLRTIYNQPQGFKPSLTVRVRGLKKNTSIRQLVGPIKKKTGIDIKATDIFKKFIEGTDFVRIKCGNMDDSKKLAKTLNLSELNGTKIMAKVMPKRDPKGSKQRKKLKKRKVMAKLSAKMAKLSANKSGSKPKIVKKGGSSGKHKLNTKGKKGKKGKKGGKQKKKGGIKKTVKV